MYVFSFFLIDLNWENCKKYQKIIASLAKYNWLTTTIGITDVACVRQRGELVRGGREKGDCPAVTKTHFSFIFLLQFFV